MNRTWFEQNPALLQEVRSAIAADQPDLHETIIDGAVRLRGSYAVRDGGTVLDRYQIEIRFPFDYPMHLPAVEEIGRRLPRIADRHINNDGTACLLVPEEWLIAGDQSFKTFLHGPLKNFFLGQLLVEVGKPWPSESVHTGTKNWYKHIWSYWGLPIQVRSSPISTACEKRQLKVTMTVRAEATGGSDVVTGPSFKSWQSASHRK
jgi:hypothetical protein